MREAIARVAFAVTLILISAIGAHAAGARLTWREKGDAERYRLFVAQPNVDDELDVREIHIVRPKRGDHGAFYFDIHGIDPSRPSLFLMVSISDEGYTSPGSNIVELATENFCEMFDANDDGKITPVDALAVARKALGLKAQAGVDGSIITALEILRISSSLQCV
jgi:hypothetical protein